MKLIKTIKIKVGDLSNNKTNVLNTLLNKNIKAINFCLNKAKKGKTITHQLVYGNLRKMNLPACIIHGCRAKSTEMLKTFNREKNKNIFPSMKNSSIRFDNQVFKLRKTNNVLYKYFVSLSCLIKQKLFLAKCQKEQASINNAFNGTMPEPKAEKDRFVEKITTERGVMCNFSQS